MEWINKGKESCMNDEAEHGDNLYPLLNPRKDVIFKRIFGCSEHPLILLDLINAIFSAFEQFGGQKYLWKDIQVINPALEPEHVTDKSSTLDIKAMNSQGHRVNIEMQSTRQYDWPKRSLYYWSKMFGEQVRKRAPYSGVKTAISINLLDFTLFERERSYSLYELKEHRDFAPLDDLLRVYFIEFPKGKKDPSVPEPLKHWVQFFNANTIADLDKITKKHTAVQEAITMLKIMNQDSRERELYEARVKSVMDYESNMHGAEQKGKVKGKAEGLIEGKAEGLREGKAVGLIEGQATILRNQCIAKYGQCPDWTSKKLQTATSEDLNQWSIHLLKSDSLDDWLHACRLSKN